ncbi:MAG: hypothetical protein LQ352_003413 [Teloschistes flavicans]|nr:MAG: hypothetical protein LQ352_003413 [Teloschistes flavicans]
MAPVRESIYFPPLDKCLDGRHELFSWRTTYIGLKELDYNPGDESLERHLTDPQTLDLLKRSFTPDLGPTSEARSTFNTKTSAINTVPSAQGRFDIQQIKDDTLWLSTEAKLNEVAALRIVVLERQTRPAEHLQDSSLADDRSIALGAGSFNGSRTQPTLSVSRSAWLPQPTSSERLPTEAFDSDDARHIRLFKIYLAERRYRLKTCKYLAITASCRVGDGKAASSGLLGSTPKWVDSVGNEILTAWDIQGVSEYGGRNIFLSGIDTLRARIRGLEEGSGWFRDMGLQEAVEASWCESQIIEMVAVLELMLVMLGNLTQMSRSGVVSSWFRLMSDYGFFETFEPPLRELYDTREIQLQSLSSLVSVAILRIPYALRGIESLSASTSSEEESAGSAPYLLNPDACSEISEVLVNAASECLRVASPAVLAWSIILQDVREQAFILRETRETRQSIHAAERFRITASPDVDHADQTSTRGSGSSLRRVSSTGSDTPQQTTFLEQLLDQVLLIGVDGDPIAYLARAALDGSGVLNVIAALSINFCTPFGSDHRGKWGLKMRHVLMDLVKASLTLIDYQPDLIETTLAVLTGSENYWQLLERPREFREAEPAAIFLEDDTFMDRLFYQAQSRFPYETLPFLKLSRALAVCFADQGEEGIPALWPKLAMTNSFTSRLPLSFAAYRLIEDDEESSFIQLTASLETFQGESAPATPPYKRLKQSSSLITAESMNLRRIPEGTKGLVLSETKPLVVRWYHEYSPLAYFGILLNSALMRGSMTDDSLQTSSPSFETVTEIIDLISLLILTTSKGELLQTSYFTALEMTQSILDNASEGLNRGQDIISVIFDIFEQELGRQPQGTDGASLAILNRCIQFAQALLHTMPDRVWPFLGRSALLGIKDGDSQLSVVLASTEIAMAKYDFLVGCIHLYESLINDATSHAVSRKTPTRMKGRFSSSQSQNTGVSQIVMKKVLLSFQRTLLDVYESIPAWKFVQIDQKFDINSRLSTIFNRVLTCCFGIEDRSNANEKLSGPLMPAAEHTINVFLSTSGTEITQDYFTSMLNEGVVQALSVEPFDASYWIQQTVSALRLVTALLRLNTMLEYPQSSLEVQMLRSVSLLARCYTSFPFRQPVVELLQVLVHNANRVDGQPASLLGHMGEDTACQFLESLLTIDEPLCSKELSASIWRLLSDVVSKRQQWFAISVLTGETPRKIARKSSSGPGSSNRGSSLLNVALDGLSNIGRLPLRTASAMLEFVALAADSWPWTFATAEQHPYFLTAITEYISQVETVSNTTQNRSNQAGMEYYKIQLTSHITEILAMYTHYSRQNGKRSYAKDLLPNLAYVSKAAITSPNYNASLQSNLRQNFEAKFQDCKLTTFKRTPLRPTVLGISFYFDMEILNHFLRLDPSWQGRSRDGFAAELARANVNLSVVEAQISLFHSWRYLAVELTKSLAGDADYQKVMVEVVTDCLRTNTQNTLPQAVFERLAQSRADLAFTLLQSLIRSKTPRPEIKSILFTAWDAMRAHGLDLTIVLDNDHAAYARTLLKILCLSIQAHAHPQPFQGAATQESNQKNDSRARFTAANTTLFTVLEILKIVVANGFRSLTTLLHDAQPPRILPSDFALLSAILRTSILIPGIERHTTALLSTFADAQTSRYAATLLSWSDQLATNRDPIYGELSINFLLEMSGMPALAESLAVEGILNHICSTNLITFLRSSSNKGIGPFDQPARLYNIWVRGILPLLLNLLHAVGASMATEIAANLNQFSNQIARASSMFTFHGSPSSSIVSAGSTQGYITLSMISEAQTLAIITSILDTYRQAGASAGVASAEIVEVAWEKSRVREDVELWLQQKSVLREKLVPVGEREEEWTRMKPVKAEGSGGVGNRLEERAVEEMGVLMMLLAEKEE